MFPGVSGVYVGAESKQVFRRLLASAEGLRQVAGVVEMAAFRVFAELIADRDALYLDGAISFAGCEEQEGC